MQPSLLLILLSICLPALARAHDSDQEAERFREARLAEILDRTSVFSTPETRLMGSIAPNAVGIPRVCKYVSGIGTPPPAMKVALTFDDGPDREATLYILDVLEKYKVHATFFMIGRSAEANPELVKRVLAAGHLIVANHSWTHPDFHKISPAAQAEELTKNEALLGAYQSPKLFRYPYGNSTCETNDLAHAHGYKIVGWHVDSCDWAFDKTGAVSARDAGLCEVQPQNMGKFADHVVERLTKRKGGIILLHEIHPNTIHQLDAILERLVHDGFTFGNLNDEDFQPSLR